MRKDLAFVLRWIAGLLDPLPLPPDDPDDDEVLCEPPSESFGRLRESAH